MKKLLLILLFAFFLFSAAKSQNYKLFIGCDSANFCKAENIFKTVLVAHGWEMNHWCYPLKDTVTFKSITLWACEIPHVEVLNKMLYWLSIGEMDLQDWKWLNAMTVIVDRNKYYLDNKFTNFIN